MTNDVKDGLVAVASGVGGGFLHWTKVAGDVAGAFGAVLGALGAAVALWRLIRRHDPKH
mgnify:CR=1 FL=1